MREGYSKKTFWADLTVGISVGGYNRDLIGDLLFSEVPDKLARIEKIVGKEHLFADLKSALSYARRQLVL